MNLPRKSLLWLVFIFPAAFAQETPPFLTQHNAVWVEKTLQSLTLEEKIGQMLMPRGNTSGKGYKPAVLKEWVTKYKIGGLVFFAGQPTRQVQIVNELQALSKVPMLIGMDLEWGLAMRLDSTVRFPYQMTLGAMQGQDELLYQMGQEVAKQAKRMGVHINYAPVVDINNNPANPVINFRSFGEDRELVMKKALAYMKGMQSERFLTTAKHFPGHGDTGVDSHYDLPVISHDKNRLKELELYPFQGLINAGLSGIMTAHLSIPQLEPTPNLASTFSQNIVTNLLRKEMGFQGLVFTDAMDMQGAVKNFPKGQALVKAILAGNDILETFEEVPQAFEAILAAVKSGELKESVINQRVRKILMAKSWVGLDQYAPTAEQNLVPELNTRTSDWLNRLLAEKSLTVLRNTENLLPIAHLDQKIGVLSLGSTQPTAFQRMAGQYTNLDSWQAVVVDSDSAVAAMLQNIRQVDQLVVGLHLPSIRPYGHYGITAAHEKWVAAIQAAHPKAIWVVMGNPYALDKIPSLKYAKGLILTSQQTPYLEEAAAQGIFGAVDMTGRLPVTVNADFPLKSGQDLRSIGRLAFGIPEMVGISRGDILESRVDSVIQAGLKAGAYPGATMEIIKDGRVIYQKAFGASTFEAQSERQQQPRFEQGTKADVMDGGKNTTGTKAQGSEIAAPLSTLTVQSLYDVASLTKITTAALAILQWKSEGKFDWNEPAGTYFPEWKGTNKENLRFIDMLTHRSGLKAWIPFWMDAVDTVATLKKASLDPRWASEWIQREIPRTFWQKLRGKEKSYEIDYVATLETRRSLWMKILSPETITWKSGVFSQTASVDYPVEVADSLFLHRSYGEKIARQIQDSPVKPTQGYVYSDLHYYLYPKLGERLTGLDWDTYLKKTYRSIGATTLTYNPRKHFPLNQIVPTEHDTLFRKTLIHGRVHDEGAALLGGISGHAGLFGSVHDVAKLMYLYLKKGTLAGKTYFKAEDIDAMTAYAFPEEKNRRGIAFDKLDFDPKIANGPRLASPESYGHSGFTGTFTWVDPVHQLVYVFLSNRVYPTRDNGKISSMNIRTEVGNVIYRSLPAK